MEFNIQLLKIFRVKLGYDLLIKQVISFLGSLFRKFEFEPYVLFVSQMRGRFAEFTPLGSTEQHVRQKLFQRFH